MEMHRFEDLAGLVARVLATRRATSALAEPLELEDWVAQSMPDASPVKWHLAHSSWFFERFVLRPLGIAPVSDTNDFLWNSYYESVGKRVERAKRGLMTRPTVRDVVAYRAAIDQRLADLEGSPRLAEVATALELGRNHEEQHQELLLTDVKHLLAENPLLPAYRKNGSPRDARKAPALTWKSFDAGVAEIGHRGTCFAFDNESPRHKVYLAPFALASRMVTNGEYRAFIADGGYRRSELWLSEGWSWVNAHGHAAPMYWHGDQAPARGSAPNPAEPLGHGHGPPGSAPARGSAPNPAEPLGHGHGPPGSAPARGSAPNPAEPLGHGHGPPGSLFTLDGLRPIDDAEPVTHVTYYEADAYAHWANARLPTEPEWEVAAAGAKPGRFLENGALHPSIADEGDLVQMLGDAWEWTTSAYAPYPGFSPLEGAFGEYNGKFMVSQMVLRGASCATPQSHARTTYRNFFPPSAAWQFTGIRLAKDIA